MGLLQLLVPLGVEEDNVWAVLGEEPLLDRLCLLAVDDGRMQLFVDGTLSLMLLDAVGVGRVIPKLLVLVLLLVVTASRANDL